MSKKVRHCFNCFEPAQNKTYVYAFSKGLISFYHKVYTCSNNDECNILIHDMRFNNKRRRDTDREIYFNSSRD